MLTASVRKCIHIIICIHIILSHGQLENRKHYNVANISAKLEKLFNCSNLLIAKEKEPNGVYNFHVGVLNNGNWKAQRALRSCKVWVVYINLSFVLFLTGSQLNPNFETNTLLN